jgi:hypothetical protein
MEYRMSAIFRFENRNQAASPQGFLTGYGYGYGFAKLAQKVDGHCLCIKPVEVFTDTAIAGE